MWVVGIDLAGVPHRPTGFCLLGPRLAAKTRILHEDEEIIEAVLRAKPGVVCVDAPLAIPKERCCLRDDCVCRRAGHLRECDRQLLRMGIKFFPVTLGPMRKLTIRGIRLKAKLLGYGLKVHETYPGAVQDLLGFPRKQHSLERLRRALIRFGVGGDVRRKGITHDELDAVTCALVGNMYLRNEYVAIGDPQEVLMILPSLSAQ